MRNTIFDYCSFIDLKFLVYRINGKVCHIHRKLQEVINCDLAEAAPQCGPEPFRTYSQEMYRIIWNSGLGTVMINYTKAPFNCQINV